MTPKASWRSICTDCPLLGCEGLRPLDKAQLKFMQGFKQGEFQIDKGTQSLVQGSISPHVYTLLEGVLFRYRILEDGRRQIVNFVFPGDLIGLQGALDDPLLHGCEALTPATLCVFSRDRMVELFSEQSRLGYDLIWQAAKEESALEEHMVSIGRRTAKERVVYLALFLIERARGTGLLTRNRFEVSITQGQIGDTLGLSLVHTNRTLQALRRMGLVDWTLSAISVPDIEAASAFSHYEGAGSGIRPYI